jgi:predicted ribonuclease YlaK
VLIIIEPIIYTERVLYETADLINFAQYRDQWWVLVNKEMNLRVPRKKVDFMTRWAATDFTARSLFHVVSLLVTGVFTLFKHSAEKEYRGHGGQAIWKMKHVYIHEEKYDLLVTSYFW